MDIINASISADLSVTSIEEGLAQLNNKNTKEIKLLVANTHSFSEVYEITQELNFPLRNVDTASILKEDSWLLIDYRNKRMYYSEGA